MLQGELEESNNISYEDMKWNVLIDDMKEAVFKEHLSYDQFIEKYVSDIKSMNHRLWMQDSMKFKKLFNRIIIDFRIKKDKFAGQQSLTFINQIIKVNPSKYLYLKKMSYLAVSKIPRKAWWFCEEEGETFKTSNLKAMKHVLGNSVILLGTFGDMNHMSNLLKKQPYLSAIFVDVPKGGAKDIVTTVIEQLGNGYISSVMYEGFNSISIPYSFFFCSNEPAPVDSFTKNRMYELQIFENDLKLKDGTNLSEIINDMPSDDTLEAMTLEEICSVYSKLDKQM
eukprot:534550_1